MKNPLSRSTLSDLPWDGSGMAVTIDAKSIRAQLRQFGDNVLLMAKSKPVLSAEVVREAAIAAEAEETSPWIGSVMVVPAGVVIGLEGLADEMLAFVESLAAELAGRIDADVVLAAARPQVTPAWMLAAPPTANSLSVWMAHHVSERLAGPWAPDSATTRRVATAVARELEPADVTMATIEYELSLNYTGVSIADAAPELLRMNPVISFSTGRRDPLVVRTASFWAPGAVAVWFGRPSSGVAEDLAAGRRLLVSTAESTVYGAVMTGRPASTPEGLPLASSSHYFAWSRYWDRVVPDAYGVQVLGPGHLERIGDLSGWVTTRLDGGGYLVEARDLGAWFDDPVPDPDVRAAARHDFAGVILSSLVMSRLRVPNMPQSMIDSATSMGTLAGGNG